MNVLIGTAEDTECTNKKIPSSFWFIAKNGNKIILQTLDSRNKNNHSSDWFYSTIAQVYWHINRIKGVLESSQPDQEGNNLEPWNFSVIPHIHPPKFNTLFLRFI